MKHPGAYPFVRSKLPFIALFLILVFILPRTNNFGHEYKKGSVWKYETLYAQFDFPILKSDQQVQEEAALHSSSPIPYFRYSEETVNKSLKGMSSLPMDSYPQLRPFLVSAMGNLFTKGIIADDILTNGWENGQYNTDILYIQKDKRAVKHPSTEVYHLSDAKAKLLALASEQTRIADMDSVLRANGVYDLLVPNLTFDKQTSQLVQAESTDVVSPTQGYVSAGQLIVAQGEIVTAEICQMLDSYKAEYETNLGYSGPVFLQWLGNVILSLILVLVLYLAIFFTNRTAFRETGKLLFIITVFLISTVSAIVVGKHSPDFLYMVPFTLTALWLQAFFKNKLVGTMYIMNLIPLLIFSHSGVVLFTMYLTAGYAGIYAFRFFNKGWQQFVSALITFAVLICSYIGFWLTDNINGSFITVISFLFIGSMLTVMGYPMIYLFEKVFGLISNSRLMDLADTSNPLLRELETKAPGTFQHSLQVMSMADSVARSLGADALLVRVGAIYHDIGKMANPQCFIENESLLHLPQAAGYHSQLTPKQSARDILGHVKDGIEIAEKHNLPSLVKDFIMTHHGTTCATYFLTKYLNDGGDPEDVADFYYPGRRPVSKEQVILMLCDSVEAASRTVKSTSPDAYNELVEKIAETKMSAGQFDDADISLKELNYVKAAIKSYLEQLYHQRVVYPKRNKR